MDVLDDLSKAVDACTSCGLHKIRSRPEFGRGSATASLMFVCEAPIADDAVGVPFVGGFVEKLTIALGVSADEVYLTYAVKCMTPFGLAPSVTERQACRPHLAKQIAAIQPKVIVTLGSTAMKALLGPDMKVTDGMGKWGEVDGIPVMPTYHPALWLKEKKYQREFRKHMLLMMERLGRSLPTTKRTKNF